MVYNSNPAAIAPDQNAVLRGLRRDDLFTVVLEQFQTDTADYADILLPVTTFLEHTDLYLAYGHYYLQLARPALPPPGETQSNVEIFRLLAERMGFDDACFADSEDDMIRTLLDSPHPFLQGHHAGTPGPRAFRAAQCCRGRRAVPALRRGRLRHARREVPLPRGDAGLHSRRWRSATATRPCGASIRWN